MQTQDTYNRGGLIAFIFSMTFSLVFFAYIGLIHPGIDLKEVPTEALSNDLAGAGDGSKPAVAAVDISKIQTPWEPNEAMVAHGAMVYKANCAVCHGDKGLGDGPAGQALVPPPRNFVEGKWKQGGDSISLYKTIAEGVPGSSMVSFKHLPKADRFAVIQFIHSITKNKIEDDPAKLAAFAKTAE